MKMLTKAIIAKLPALYSTESVPLEQKVAVVKFFTPWSNWTWYAVEGSEQEDGDTLFFGRVDGLESEWGNFSLREIESVTGPAGLKIERDLWFKPQPLPKAPL
jgi:hypothetical protein